MGFGDVMSIGALMLGPTLAIGAFLHLPRALRALRRVVQARGPRTLAPGPPIECIAADLRRLVVQHDQILSNHDLAMRAHHLRALELAITDKAIEGATALDVPRPVLPANGCLTHQQLGTLLRQVHAAGLELPIDASLFMA
ncbi:MAG: hypothetical protein QOF39_1072 [Frankiales bacterium]|nr:hypothetical protein [Frankiales bacterium]